MINCWKNIAKSGTKLRVKDKPIESETNLRTTIRH